MKKGIFTIVLFFAAFAAGFLISRFLSENDGIARANQEKSQIQETEWTCSMHPQIRQPKPGRCPICSMELVDVSSDSSSSSTDAENIVKLTANAAKFAEIELSPVIRDFDHIEINMPGKIDFDETRLSRISARFPGRIDRLYVNYTGVAVKKGEHLAEIFSPDLQVAQREALLTLRGRNSEPIPSNLLKSVKEKFRTWGFEEKQVDEIISRGEISEHLTLLSPMTGIVIEKNVFEGEHFEKGKNLFLIADLSKVWVMLDAFETDIAWIRYAQDIDFFVEAYPDRKFSGKVAFISPTLDEKTRTVKIRINVDNPDGALRPGFFVKARLIAKIAGDGSIVNPYLAGKWISPMHPEIVKDSPGKCDVCGMALVSAESFGYASPAPDKNSIPLLIPSTAPLITGKRAVVYVKKAEGEYECREVTLGHKTRSHYLVISGLKEGELVVSKGNFKIDSAAQILAKSSMMSKFGDKSDENPKEIMWLNLRDSLGGDFSSKIPSEEILDGYFSVQKALAADDFNSIEKFAKPLDKYFNTTISEASDINSAREIFQVLSSLLWKQISNSKNIKRKIYRFHCPMAFDNKGAHWLQDDAKIANPYFGSAMPRCGSLAEEISGE